MLFFHQNRVFIFMNHIFKIIWNKSTGEPKLFQN
ncbi:hypothetical protein DLJ98_01525 [Haemophilus influenzae]|nr:hypothetical protein DLJ98_01525 [Haemophilus influenzae]